MHEKWLVPPTPQKNSSKLKKDLPLNNFCHDKANVFHAFRELFVSEDAEHYLFSISTAFQRNLKFDLSKKKNEIWSKSNRKMDYEQGKKQKK